MLKYIDPRPALEAIACRLFHSKCGECGRCLYHGEPCYNKPRVGKNMGYWRHWPRNNFKGGNQ